ncbi:amino acid--tRNA ligase-related protein [Saccharopolyspora pogona]|uniref:amino acid--tRNA ligase-related protein n=1 Tax=Saccharopolyspora pogona TaxID=333966 RepID=UPI00168214CD|nr:amino acid--tRNA ligase-related protein [Saccharopolyspora pogona]
MRPTGTPVDGTVPLSSPWIGMNLLMVRPDLAIVDAAQTELIAALQRHGIHAIPHTLRHARALGGGFHCVTLDLRRDGELADYTERRPTMPSPRPTPPPPAAAGGALVARYQQLREATPARRALIARSRVQAALRRALHEDGFLEVDTPLLQHCRPAPGRSFNVDSQFLDPHTYLRSSPLHLRGLLTAGHHAVFEIGRSFRDEPADATHSAEYSLIEIYQAGGDYLGMRDLAQQLICTAARAATGTTTITTPSGQTIDLATPWPVIAVYDAITEALGMPITPCTTTEQLRQAARAHDVPHRPESDADELVLELYDHLVEPTTTTPIVYSGFPSGPSPLAATQPDNAAVAQKWDLVIRGREIATGYTETSDPTELQRRMAPDGDRILPSEASTLDTDWQAVFNAGLPTPSGGLCIGLERLLLLITDLTQIQDVIPFPLQQDTP